MNQKSIIASLLFSLFIYISFSACADHDKTQKTNNQKSLLQTQPNIILILADDLGYETLQANGGESYSTPNLNTLASEGMRFEHCYAQPQCTPSRVQLLTGIYNVRNYVSFGVLDTSQVTLANILNNAGYETGIAGKWQLGKNPDNPQQLGFDEYLLWQLTEGRVDSTDRDTRYSQPVLDHNGKLRTYDKADYAPKLINDFSLEFIERNHKNGKPFFLMYSMLLTHCPFSPTPESAEWMKDTTSIMSYKGKPEYFDDMVSYMDLMVGNIESKLNEMGAADNTIILFMGDNGTDTPIVSQFQGKEIAGGKFLSTDAGTRVPLIVKWPRVIKPESINENLIDFTDFMPTILEAVNISIPDSLDLDGKSFLPQLKGKMEDPRNYVYSWFANPFKEEPVVFARTKQFKLYNSGNFYDVSNDYLEEKPLKIDSLDQAEIKIYQQLQQVIQEYADRRLDAIPQENMAPQPN